MAELLRENQDLVLRLSTLEKVEAIHGDVRVPWINVQSITIKERIMDMIHGMRLPGTSIPGLLAVGTFISKDGRTFAVIHHDTQGGLVVQLRGESYDRLVVGFDDPQAVLTCLEHSASD